ncbi:Eco57I restriction-modification methylase domain-containing protein [Rathayibacter sp. VKM Ac-2929]|uniref:Eco57I restriction-modification methylase domain-containing protein n=1 Tax=Rathayibacter sp. VKM Ac-2929 TaxID=2929480 RepID=UPI001FB53C73|nr:Eco57I restriction-modification methylase domain-containing protein [Rathayibacter sp. VKM Ac-2929]MCJ1675674.1 Eco57I restriction-modification methylase domain-containing protein [Rathayibacter sp. VKM Ac-2929]
MPLIRPSKDAGRQRIIELVERYRPQAAHLTASNSIYTETDARVSFIDPLLEALGWDVRNEGGLSQRESEVVMERVGSDANGAWGRPDYRLRLAGADVMPVEAKRPSVAIGVDSSSSVQARSYGFALSLPAAVLTNFDQLIIFDTKIAPLKGDSGDVAALPGGRFTFEEYVTRFDELWDLLSHESLADGGLERVYSFERPPRGQSPFDKRFFTEFRGWRRTLAQAIAHGMPELGAAEVGRRTQRLLNALLFLRVCEDRNIGRYEDLLGHATHRRVVQAFKDADRAFNAGLFTVLRETTIDDSALVDVITQMYWPRTQFAFGVLDPIILAGVYEQYLAEQVVLAEDRTVTLSLKPEIQHAGGVVSTPDYIVQEIGAATLDPLLVQGTPDGLTVLDPAVGSGVFLLDAFERIITATEITRGAGAGLAERGELAQRHLFGVDIDGAAVEVTKLSLLLAVLGGEQLEPATARNVLPNLDRNVVAGNTVVRDDFDKILPDIAKIPFRRARVSPLDLQTAIGASYPTRGFSAIIGNPPYVRIQVMAEHLTEQLEYLQDPRSKYESPKANNFDLYQVFIERALQLLSPNGRLGLIVPHRFTNHLSASGVRKALSKRLERLVHFSEQQVFPGRLTYVAIIIAGPQTSEPVALEVVTDLPSWRASRAATVRSLDRSTIGAATWPIRTEDQDKLFAQLEAGAIARLGDPDWVHLFVGVQTSADEYYFIKPTPATAHLDVVSFTDHSGVLTKIERSLLRPAIKDRRISDYDGQPDPDVQVIFPYDSSETPARPKVISVDAMKHQYPHAHAYFERHRTWLTTKRKVSPDPGEAFWAYGRSQSLGKLNEPKLIARTLSLSPLYALDSDGLVVPGGGDGGPYTLLRPQPNCAYSIDIIQALLSHPAVDLYVAVNGKKFSGSYAVHRKAFLAEVPVPPLSVIEQKEIEEKVRELRTLAIALRTEHDTEAIKSIRARRYHVAASINEVVTAAYGLDSALVLRTTSEAGS